MQKPRIVIISGKHPIRVKSGYAHYAASLAKTLTGLHCDVHIFCIGDHNDEEVTPIGTIHSVYVPFLRLFGDCQMVTLPLSALLIARRIPKSSLVWGIGPWTLAGILAGHTPVIADYFTTLKHEYGISLFTLLERFILKKSNTILTHYKSTERIISREFGIKNFVRVPYSVDVKPVSRGLTREKIILTVCRNDPRKGITYLTRAYAILRGVGLRFRAIIIGPGQPRGPVDDLTPYFRTAYCFVLPSLEEGSGSLAVLEAMAAGIPIIATRVDGIPEDVQHNVSGILVPPGDAPALANAIRTLLTNPALARRMGLAARKQFTKAHGARRVTFALRTFINDVIVQREITR